MAEDEALEEDDLELGHGANANTVPLLTNHNVAVQNPNDQGSGSVCKVHPVYRDRSPESYTPQVASIGPIHHRDKHLQDFEVDKNAEKNSLFRDVFGGLESPPEQILLECDFMVRNSIDEIRAFYIEVQEVNEYTPEELAQMMITDGFFIIAILYKISCGISLGPNEYLKDQIIVDMVLMENQIPFCVLQGIHNIIFRHVPLEQKRKKSIFDLIFEIQKIISIYDVELVLDKAGMIKKPHGHILEILHKSYRHPIRYRSQLPFPRKDIKAHSAVELERSGVRFSELVTPRRKIDEKFLMAMELKLSRFLGLPLSFFHTAVLKMRILRLGYKTESIVRNLIVYEHFSNVQTCITSYMHALNKLIDTPEDVATLVKSEVLVNELGSDEIAANLINNVLKEFPVKDFYYQDEWKEMDEHCDAKWPRFIAELRGSYFNSPWKTIALIAATILFILTAIQTLYSVKD